MVKQRKATPKVEVVVKKVGDQPYVTELLVAGITPTSGIMRWDSDKEAAGYLVGGSPEWVHVGGKIHACVNGNGLLRGLPYNSCGFLGDFFFACLLPSGKTGVMSEGDKRRVFKWYEANKDQPAPDAKPSANCIRTPEDFEKHSEAAQLAAELRNEEWRKL